MKTFDGLQLGASSLAIKRFDTLKIKIMTQAKARSFSIASPEQLQALGRLTLNYALLDEKITMFAVALSKLTRGGESRDHVDKLRPQRLKDKLKSIKHLIREIRASSKNDAGHLLELIENAFNLADHRNDIVHGWIDIDEQRDRAVFNNKNKLRSSAAKDIDDLNDQLLKWTRDFDRESFGLIWGVAKKSQANKKHQRALL